MTADASAGISPALARANRYPRLRYMGSKYRLLANLARIFNQLGGNTAADPFSGSGVVSYLLKSLGYRVASGDYLSFPTVIARATTVNDGITLTDDEIERLCGDPADDRDFISNTFAGLYFTDDDRRFLDSAWSHIDLLDPVRRNIALAALILSAARRQPRGVFTFTDASRYADGRRDLTLSLRQHFRERVAEYNSVIFADGKAHTASQRLVSDFDQGPYDVVYLDPPYAPPSDDNDYIKRYSLSGRAQHLLAWRYDHASYTHQEARKAFHAVRLQTHHRRGSSCDVRTLRGIRCYCSVVLDQRSSRCRANRRTPRKSQTDRRCTVCRASLQFRDARRSESAVCARADLRRRDPSPGNSSWR